MYRKSASKEYLQKISALHKNLQFTLLKVDANGQLALRELNICVRRRSKIYANCTVSLPIPSHS